MEWWTAPEIDEADYFPLLHEELKEWIERDKPWARDTVFGDNRDSFIKGYAGSLWVSILETTPVDPAQFTREQNRELLVLIAAYLLRFATEATKDALAQLGVART